MKGESIKLLQFEGYRPEGQMQWLKDINVEIKVKDLMC